MSFLIAVYISYHNQENDGVSADAIRAPRLQALSVVSADWSDDGNWTRNRCAHDSGHVRIMIPEQLFHMSYTFYSIILLRIFC